MPAKLRGQKIHSIIPHQLNSTISPKPGEAQQGGHCPSNKPWQLNLSMGGYVQLTK